MSRRDEIIQSLLVEPTDSDQYPSSEEMLGKCFDAAIEEVRKRVNCSKTVTEECQWDRAQNATIDSICEILNELQGGKDEE
jgi:hypothetical protein